MNKNEIVECLAEHKKAELERLKKIHDDDFPNEIRFLVSDAISKKLDDDLSKLPKLNEYEIEFEFHYDNTPERPITRKETVYGNTLKEAVEKLEKKYPNFKVKDSFRKIHETAKQKSPAVTLLNKSLIMEESGEKLHFDLEHGINSILLIVTNVNGYKNRVLSIDKNGYIHLCNLSSEFLKYFNTNSENEVVIK